MIKFNLHFFQQLFKSASYEMKNVKNKVKWYVCIETQCNLHIKILWEEWLLRFVIKIANKKINAMKNCL